MSDTATHKPIGGYFEPEPDCEGKGNPHPSAAWLNTGRNALEYVLAILPSVRKVYIPYFTCDVVLEPFTKLGVPYEYYHINRRLELPSLLQLGEGEYLLYTNYYGIKDAYVRELHAQYGTRLIVDNAQGFFMPPIPDCMMVYSPRKFVGLPDGGFAYPRTEGVDSLPFDVSKDRMAHLRLRQQYGPQAGYAAFKENSRKLVGLPVMQMSCETRQMLSRIDFDAVQTARHNNFAQLHAALGCSNSLAIPDLSSFAAPLVYPYFSADAELKSRLIAEQVFVATYWPNVLHQCRFGDVEYELAEHVVCLPIDQRYDEADMTRILNIILPL